MPKKINVMFEQVEQKLKDNLCKGCVFDSDDDCSCSENIGMDTITCSETKNGKTKNFVWIVKEIIEA